MPGSVPRDGTVAPSVAETPHVHGVCRRCGRIADVDVPPQDLAVLSEIARRGPVGWQVEGITFSLTGICPKCRGERGF